MLLEIDPLIAVGVLLAKAINDYAEKASMAYLCNWFYHPVIKGYFLSKGIAVDEDLYAVSVMMQLIWRSRIRNDKPIHLFIPSERMRTLLKLWLADELVGTGGQIRMAARSTEATRMPTLVASIPVSVSDGVFFSG